MNLFKEYNKYINQYLINYRRQIDFLVSTKFIFLTLKIYLLKLKWTGIIHFTKTLFLPLCLSVTFPPNNFPSFFAGFITMKIKIISQNDALPLLP